MGYSLVKTNTNGNRVILIVDDATTMPSLFITIYITRKLSRRKIGTQLNELQALRYFYEFYEKKYNRTFDVDFYAQGLNIEQFIQDLESFFPYLASSQHTSDEYSERLFDGSFSNIARANYGRYVASVCRYFKFLNERYMNVRYQDLPLVDVSMIYRGVHQKLCHAAKSFSALETAKNSPATRYKSLSSAQSIQLNNMLLPSMTQFVDPDTGEIFPEVINPLNPFRDGFEQFRNYMINRLMFQYGLRIGECLLLTTRSFGPTVPDAHGNVHHVLLVQGLPDGIDDPRISPPSIKTKGATRKLALEMDDYTMLSIYCEQRCQLFQARAEIRDHGFLFIKAGGTLSPLSYDGVKSFYKKIDSAFITAYPYYRAMPDINIEYMVNITPHVGRHTWAYMTLEYIYNEMLNEELRLTKTYGITARMKSLLDAAADSLRVLGGWSSNSKMPMRYAKRFVEKIANESNLGRTHILKRRTQIPSTSNSIDQNIPTSIDSLSGDFNEFI